MLQEFFFTATDGEILAGEMAYPESRAGDCGVVFFIAGAFACDRNGSPLGFPALENYFLPLKKEIVSQLNLATYTYDRRKTGKSSVKNTSVPAEKDILSAYEQLVRFDKIDFGKVILLGQSYGAGVVKKFYPEFKKILPPRGIVLLSSSGSGLESIDVPVHVVIGAEDDPQNTDLRDNIEKYGREDVSWTHIPRADHMLCEIDENYRGWTGKPGSCKMSPVAAESIMKWLESVER